MVVRRTSLRRWLVIASLSLATVACNRGSAPAPHTNTNADANDPPAAEAGPACDATHAEALEQELMAQCNIHDLVVVLDVPAAPWKPAPAARPDEALPIELSPAGVMVFSGEAGPVAEMREHLAEKIEMNTEMAQLLGKPASSAWVLAITGQTPRNNVATVLSTLAEAKLLEGYLWLGAATPPSLPRPRDPKRLAELVAQLAKRDSSDKAAYLAQELERASPCPAFAQAFENEATNPTKDHCRSLAHSVAQGLVSCGCRDEDALMTLLHVAVLGEPPKSSDRMLGAAVPVTLDPAAVPRPGATWAEIVAGLDEHALAGLWVEPPPQ